ncbi:MAG: DUF3570 domain-containing protein [Lewinellaceae bacterium]|nr:DUF3570 domain-containing protein [Phaeodactylibacter sp.]MCB9042093.1 DUF3570 domain-containing protein [Lewinellaceae bacterium]
MQKSIEALQLFFIIGLLLIIQVNQLPGQSPLDSAARAPIDVNILFNYYTQEGNNSAVTGGVGTEELTDYDTRIIAIIPVDSASRLSAEAGFNTYSSASTDRIDSRMSSASSSDIRAAIQLGWEQEKPETGQSYSWSMGGSVESDYLSMNLHGSYYLPLKGEQSALFVDAQAFFGRWVLYFPEELRDTVQPFITTDRRFSYHLDLQYQYILNRRTSLALSTGFSFQHGLLSTPFHRVYFTEGELPRIERLPAQRWAWPASLRLHYFAGGGLITRFFYRYYRDGFGVRAHSLELELPLKLSPIFTLTPVYRYHRQRASSFFEPYRINQPGAEFYTSDYDLSTFSSHKIGLGLQLSPIGRWRMLGKRRLGELTSISLRIAHYRRSDGLRAWMGSMLWGWAF